MARKKKPGQIRVPNPARKEWDEGKGKCDVCGPEPANSKEAKYWRQKVYDHGHGYPPAKHMYVDPPGEEPKPKPPLSGVQWAQQNPAMAKYDNDGNPVPPSYWNDK